MRINRGGNEVRANGDKDKNLTLLHHAALSGLAETGAFLIEHGFDVNATTTLGMTPLHSAVLGGHRELVDMLLENGSYRDARNKLGGTPLLYAALKDSVGPARALLKHGADVNLADNNGSTPLHVAAAEGSLRMVKLLLSAGANSGANDSKGKTPLDLATVRAAVVIRRHIAKLARSRKNLLGVSPMTPGCPDRITPAQRQAQIENRRIVEQTLHECGLQASGFLTNAQLELYCDVLQGKREMGYISKGWDDPGFRVGDLVTVPQSQIEAVKKHAQTLMRYCATRGVTATGERKDDGCMEFHMDSVIYTDGFNKKVLAQVLHYLNECNAKARELFA
jgi:hypothetical protein